MNLNFIKLLTILQLIAVRNGSGGNNIKPQAIKRLTQMSQSIDKLTSWMSSNRLLLDPYKTQAVWLVAAGSLQRLTVKDSPLSFLTCTFSTSVRDLSAMLHTELTVSFAALLLPLRPLLPSVGFGGASGAAFCCDG